MSLLAIVTGTGCTSELTQPGILHDGRRHLSRVEHLRRRHDSPHQGWAVKMAELIADAIRKNQGPLAAYLK